MTLVRFIQLFVLQFFYVDKYIPVKHIWSISVMLSSYQKDYGMDLKSNWATLVLFDIGRRIHE